MPRIVMKFGGTSVADLDCIRNVAARVKREVEAGNQVAVVVSAMAGVTNQLVAWCQTLSPLHDAREYDTVVATGEQVTTGLLSIALQDIGVEARSWQGWQRVGTCPGFVNQATVAAQRKRSARMVTAVRSDSGATQARRSPAELGGRRGLDLGDTFSGGSGGLFPDSRNGASHRGP